MSADNPKHAASSAKPPLALIPRVAIEHAARAFAHGEQKYPRKSWRRAALQSSYVSATIRHVIAYAAGETTDPESGEHHLAHALACIAILLDAEACGSLVHDLDGEP